MCGIAGIIEYREPGSVSAEALNLMRDHMASRGPDGLGTWVSDDRSVGLTHRRLSIVDLSTTGAQPMTTSDGRLTIVFNGEIYNYKELRTELEAGGARFISNSDTEVLLHLFAEKGEAMLGVLRGMFTFAIWDRRERRLFLARDPFGIKPLYFHDDGRTLRFASQVKALTEGANVHSSQDPAGQVAFFLWGHVPEPFTLYRGIRAVPAGSWIDVRRGSQPRTHSYCSLRQIFADAEQSHGSPLRPEERGERLRSAIRDSVNRHLIADVPVGIFLSAGVDSATLTALAATNHPNLRTITLGFEEYRGTANDETVLAANVAQICGTYHQTRWIARSEFESDLSRLMSAMDQPSIDGVNSFFVSKAAAETGLKAAMSGLGGDEIFGGYPSFRQIPRLVGALGHIGSGFGKAFRIVSEPLVRRFTSPKYSGLFEFSSTYGRAYLLRRAMFMPWELPHLMDPEVAAAGWKELDAVYALDATTLGVTSPHMRVSLLELSWFMRNQLLRDCDWASMAHSLEVRVPFVDIELIRAVAPLMATDKPPDKRQLAAVASDVLPPGIMNRPKSGFSVPVRTWLLEAAQGKAARGLRGWSRFVARSFDFSAMREAPPADVPAQATAGTRIIR